jgi:GNAT superfamily N-acetyltransferase
VINTVVATIAERLARRLDERAELPDLGYQPWWAVTRDEAGQVTGAAMRTAPAPFAPLFVLPMPDEAARELARTMVARGEAVGGVNGALPAARVTAETVAGHTGGSATVLMHTRLFELGELTLPATPPGQLRLPRPDEAELVRTWLGAFHVEADEQAGREPAEHVDHVGVDDLLERISERRLWVWADDEDRPVHLTGINPPAFGVRRIGPVYTPEEHRGRGCASAAVGELSRRILADGHRACLFTDQANPTSNALYERLGYRPVVDMANLVIH